MFVCGMSFYILLRHEICATESPLWITESQEESFEFKVWVTVRRANRHHSVLLLSMIARTLDLHTRTFVTLDCSIQYMLF